MTRIELYDTTLRDGMQGEGMSLSAREKLRVAHRLDAEYRHDFDDVRERQSVDERSGAAQQPDILAVGRAAGRLDR